MEKSDKHFASIFLSFVPVFSNIGTQVIFANDGEPTQLENAVDQFFNSTNDNLMDNLVTLLEKMANDEEYRSEFTDPNYVNKDYTDQLWNVNNEGLISIHESTDDNLKESFQREFDLTINKQENTYVGAFADYLIARDNNEITKKLRQEALSQVLPWTSVVLVKHGSKEKCKTALETFLSSDKNDKDSIITNYYNLLSLMTQTEEYKDYFDMANGEGLKYQEKLWKAERDDEGQLSLSLVSLDNFENALKEGCIEQFSSVGTLEED